MRFQLLKAKTSDGENVYGVLDVELDLIVGLGTRDEIIEYLDFKTKVQNV